MRSDLSPAQICVQSCHAALEAGHAFYDPKTQDHPHIIILSVLDESALLKVASKLFYNGYEFRKFKEPDIGNELTAIACRPVCGDKRLFFAKYPLMGRNIIAHSQGEINATESRK